MSAAPPDQTAAIEAIQEAAAALYQVRMSQLLSRNRQHPLPEARQVAIWVIRHATTASLPQIARAFGQRTHATAVHSLRLVKRRRRSDKAFRRTTDDLLTITAGIVKLCRATHKNQR